MRGLSQFKRWSSAVRQRPSGLPGIGLLLWAACFPMSLSRSLAQNPPSPTTLASLRDRYRPLLLFAAKPDDPSLLAQMTRLKNAQAGLEHRDVLVIALVIAVPFNNPSSTKVALTTEDGIEARRHFNVAPDEFTVILLGKDGGEKLRSRNPVSFQKLKDLIDSMPMRQDEMQHPARR